MLLIAITNATACINISKRMYAQMIRETVTAYVEFVFKYSK